MTNSLSQPQMIPAQSILKSKKKSFDHLKTSKLGKVEHGGVYLLDFCVVLWFSFYTPYLNRLRILGSCAITLILWRTLIRRLSSLQVWFRLVRTDWFAIFSCLLAVVGLVHSSRHQRRWIWYSCFSGTLLAVFWLNYMLRMTKFRWDIIWLPFGPLSASISCLYVDHLLKQSSEEVKKLRSYMYAYKSS